MADTMMEQQIAARSPDRFAIALACLLAFLLAFTAHLIGQAEDLRPSDDNLWMYYAGSNLAHWDAGQRLNAKLVAELKAAGASDYIVRRAVLRTGYAPNMALTAGTLYGAGRVSQWLRGPTAGYDRMIGDAIQYGYIAVFFLGALVALGIVAALRRSDLALAVLLAIATVIGLSSLSEPGFFITFRVLDLPTHLSNLAAFLMNPGPQFSVFGFTPRNTVYLVSLGILALRATGRYGLAYAVVVPLAFVHQSVAALMFFLLVGLDTVLRVQIFRRVAVLVPAGGFVVLLALRENLWEVIGLRGAAVAAALAALLLVVGLAWLLRGHLVRVHSAIRRGVNRIGEMEADGLLLVLVFVLTYPLIFLVVPYTDRFTLDHFWGQLHARIWAHIQPWLLIIGWWALLRRLEPATLRRRTPILFMAALAIALPKVLTSAGLDYSLANFRLGLSQQEAARHQPFASLKEAEDREDRFFYEMARTLDTGRESLSPLFVQLRAARP